MKFSQYRLLPAITISAILAPGVVIGGVIERRDALGVFARQEDTSSCIAFTTTITTDLTRETATLTITGSCSSMLI